MDPPNIFDQPIIEDNDNFMGASKDSLSIKTITLTQYSKCCNEGSKEMSKGGVEQRFYKGQYIQVVVPNQREIYINCIKVLEGILTPDCLKRKEIKLLIETNNKELLEKEREFYSRFDKVLKDKERQDRLPNPKDKVVDFDKKLQQLGDAAELETIDIYRKRFIILTQLLDALNWFDEGSVYSN